MAACNDDDAAPPATTAITVAPAVTTTIPRLDDGILRIGVLLPQTGPGAALGQGMIAAAQEAVATANAVGALPEAIEVIVVDEGGDPDTAAQAVEELLDDHQVDAIVGPASSAVALSALDRIVSAAVVACSPTATADALTDFPDHNLFFRTIGTDELEARALAEAIAATGLGEIAIAAPDDDYGRTMFSTLTAALGQRVAVLDRLDYDPDDDSFAEEANTLLNGDPDMVAVIGDADSGPRLVTALAEADPAGSVTMLVSSALRRPSSPDVYAALPAHHLAHLTGVSPAALRIEADPAVPSAAATAAFAAEVVDCVNLIVLAAATAPGGPTDQPAMIATGMLPTSRDGLPCADVAACLEVARTGRDIDYNGPGGVTRLDTAGDVTTAVYDQFGFTDDGRDVTTGRITVSASP